MTLSTETPWHFPLSLSLSLSLPFSLSLSFDGQASILCSLRGRNTWHCSNLYMIGLFSRKRPFIGLILWWAGEYIVLSLSLSPSLSLCAAYMQGRRGICVWKKYFLCCMCVAVCCSVLQCVAVHCAAYVEGRRGICVWQKYLLQEMLTIAHHDTFHWKCHATPPKPTKSQTQNSSVQIRIKPKFHTCEDTCTLIRTYTRTQSHAHPERQTERQIYTSTHTHTHLHTRTPHRLCLCGSEVDTLKTRPTNKTLKETY